jgi:hypothetical protein
MKSIVRFSSKGVFLKHTRYFSNMIGFSVVIVLTVLLFGVFDGVREELINAAANVSNKQLIAFHCLRLLAIGSMIKYLQGDLPLHFIIIGSLPDFLFALSAAFLTFFAEPESIGNGLLIAWHLIGMTVFLGAGISMFFSVPSPVRIFHNKPDTTIVFQFPMALAPTIGVPLFILAHTFALLKLVSI